MAQKTGALIFDETADRYDIRFDIADYGDELLTLSTCSYHTKNGRFVVVARKEESPQLG